MKKSTLFAALLILAAIAVGIATNGQKPTTRTFAIDKAGNIKETTAAPKVKKPDTVYKVVNGVPIYRGAKGGLYYWKTSEKTGKAYKCYLKQEGGAR